MVDTVTTRIKLPGPVHRDVKAEAARRGINLDVALGMCVAFLNEITTPLIWREDVWQAKEDMEAWLEKPGPDK